MKPSTLFPSLLQVERFCPLCSTMQSGHCWGESLLLCSPSCQQQPSHISPPQFSTSLSISFLNMYILIHACLPLFRPCSFFPHIPPMNILGHSLHEKCCTKLSCIALLTGPLKGLGLNVVRTPPADGTRDV